MALTEREARERINHSLDDIGETARREAESRRVALVRVFAEIALEFQRLSAQSVREGRPLNAVELSRLNALVRATILRMRDAFVNSALASEAFVDFVIGSLLATHVGLITENAGPDAGRLARDAFFDRVRRIPQQVQADVRRLRRRDLEIPALASLYAEEARTAADKLLLSASVEEIDSDDVRHDLFLLLTGSDIDYGRYDLDRADVTALRGLVAAGAMITVSETFNAMRGSTWRVLTSLGLVQTGRWTLSARHAGLSSSPDHCDTLAARDVGYGAGRYLVSQWPRPPHPYCGCSLTDVKLAAYHGWLTRFSP